MLEKIRKIPKVELHLHLDGSISKEVASKISGLLEKEIISKMIAKDKCENLSEYLTKFDFPISLMQTKENLYEISKDLVNRLEKESVIYAEIRFAPMFHTREGLDYDEIIQSVLAGLRSNSHIKTNLILCMMRGMPKELNLATIDIAEKYLNNGVCALDLAGAEDKFPLEEYLDLFKIAREKNIPFTIHAGENGPASEVQRAIEVGAKRIGHGIHSIESKEVLELIKEKDILLEICPTSNVQTNAVETYKKHPIYEFYKKEIPVSINTDNITVSNVTISEEYLKLKNIFDFKIEDFKKMNENAIKHAFIDERTKEKLLKVLEGNKIFFD